MSGAETICDPFYTAAINEEVFGHDNRHITAGLAGWKPGRNTMALIDRLAAEMAAKEKGVSNV